LKAKTSEVLELAARVAHPPPHLSANDCYDTPLGPHHAASQKPDAEVAVPEGATLGMGLVDAMALVTLPDDVSAAIEAHAKPLATSLARDGASCGAARRLIARDCALAHGRLRLLEGLQGAALARWSEDRGAAHEAESLGRMIVAEHRRLLASLEALRRMERLPEPVVRIARAAIVVNR
jgi:hypothetical protein